MRLYIPKILFPAMGLPLDVDIVMEVADDIGILLIKNGWIEAD